MKRILLSILIIGFLAVGAFAFAPSKAKAITLNDINSLFEQVRSLKDEIANLKSQLTAQLKSAVDISNTSQLDAIKVIESTIYTITPTITTETNRYNLNDLVDRYFYLNSTEVWWLQTYLQEKGFYQDYEVDGIKGPGTVAAVSGYKQSLQVATAPLVTPPTSIIPTGAATLTIIKNTIPDDRQDFRFLVYKEASSYSVKFILDDDGSLINPSLTSFRRILTKLSSGSYIIEETPVPGFATKHVCSVDGKVVSASDISKAGFYLGPTSKAVCTFTNTKTVAPPVLSCDQLQKELVDLRSGFLVKPTISLASQIWGVLNNLIKLEGCDCNIETLIQYRNEISGFLRDKILTKNEIAGIDARVNDVLSCLAKPIHTHLIDYKWRQEPLVRSPKGLGKEFENQKYVGASAACEREMLGEVVLGGGYKLVGHKLSVGGTTVPINNQLGVVIDGPIQNDRYTVVIWDPDGVIANGTVYATCAREETFGHKIYPQGFPAKHF